jgi:hypothetical protein
VCRPQLQGFLVSDSSTPIARQSRGSLPTPDHSTRRSPPRILLSLKVVHSSRQRRSLWYSRKKHKGSVKPLFVGPKPAINVPRFRSAWWEGSARSQSALQSGLALFSTTLLNCPLPSEATRAILSRIVLQPNYAVADPPVSHTRLKPSLWSLDAHPGYPELLFTPHRQDTPRLAIGCRGKETCFISDAQRFARTRGFTHRSRVKGLLL